MNIQSLPEQLTCAQCETIPLPKSQIVVIFVTTGDRAFTRQSVALRTTWVHQETRPLLGGCVVSLPGIPLGTHTQL